MHITNNAMVDVLIVGAGAAGLTLAIELARRGITFRIIEKNDTPFPGSRGKGIQPRTQELFEDLGILDRIVARGAFYPPQREHQPDGTYRDSPIMEQRLASPDEPYTMALLASQSVTEAVMHERLAELGARVELSTALSHVEQDADGVTAEIASARGSQRVRARYLVGCDGGRSTVRKALGIDFPGKTLGVRAVAADIVLTGLSRDAWHRFNSTQNATHTSAQMDKQLALCPLPGGELFQLQAPVPLEGDVDLSAEGLTTMIAERTGRTDIVAHSVRWASAYTMNARLADRYSDGRIYLAGDAAHVHPPTGGQGLNTSVQDAYNLGWKLAAVLRGAPEALLATYEEERRPIAAGVLGLSATLLEAMKGGSIKRGRETQQLDLDYRGSSLSHGERDSGRTAGQRAPDAVLRAAGGQTRRLFELFQGTHWTLLAYDVSQAVEPRDGLHIHRIGPGAELDDPTGAFAASYGLKPGDYVLVRPDGYIGTVVSAAQLTTIDDYLVRVGVRAEERAAA